MHFRNLFAAGLACSLVYFCKSEEECVNVDEDGTCIEHCSENMFLYLPGCENETMSQRTCRHPEAMGVGHYCDYYRCECHEPLLWDEAAEKCVLIADCSDQTKVIEQEEKIKKEQENNTFSPNVDFTDSEFLE